MTITSIACVALVVAVPIAYVLLHRRTRSRCTIQLTEHVGDERITTWYEGPTAGMSAVFALHKAVVQIKKDNSDGT